jgi:hypothetical protein
MVCLQSAFFESQSASEEGGRSLDFRFDFVPTKPLAITLIQPKPLLEEGSPGRYLGFDNLAAPVLPH